MGIDSGSSLESIVTGGIQETAPTEIVGGLADPEAIIIASDLDRTKTLDPETFAAMKRIGVQELFDLDWGGTYAKMHSLGSLPNDDPNKIKFGKLSDIHEMGEEKYMAEHPGETEIILQDDTDASS